GADAWLPLNQLHRLVSTGTAPPFTATTTGCRRTSGGSGFVSAAFGAAGAAAGCFAAELSKRTLESLALLIKVLKASLYELPGLVEHVLSGGHLIPFLSKQRVILSESLPELHTL
ncbi:MAG: hypothetical protein ACTHK3_10625, partial [Solirubrobacterales bacterium]